uniref:Uncharacterized protein n=1 Tax=Aegilops tauschii subsp. strangulata TaxID=200361 RepID=A0A453K6Q1_AEGTS
MDLLYEGPIKTYLRWRRAAVGACGAAVWRRQYRRLKVIAALSPLVSRGNIWRRRTDDQRSAAVLPWKQRF